MNTGQTIFSIGALLLFSITALRVNNQIITTDVTMQETKLGVLGLSLATSLIEEASNKAFDAATSEDGITDLNLLTSPYGLGPGDWETPETYNDFDDYNGYTRHVDNMPSAEFDISCIVKYVTPENIDHYIMERTWHKKMTVEVSSSSMRDTIRVSKVYSYWNFR